MFTFANLFPGVLTYKRRGVRATTPGDAETEKLVILVAITFTLCHIPYFVFCYEVFVNEREGRETNSFFIAKMQDVCFSLNSAANFFIFLFCSTAFRRTFCQLFRRRPTDEIGSNEMSGQESTRDTDEDANFMKRHNGNGASNRDQLANGEPVDTESFLQR